MYTDRLKSLKTDVMSTEDMMELYHQAKAIAAEYGDFGATVPKWLTEAQNTLSRDIKNRLRDELQARMIELKSRRAALATPEERRTALDNELAALEAKLA